MKQRPTRRQRIGLSYTITMLPVLGVFLLVLNGCGQAVGSSLSDSGTPTAPPPNLTPTTAATVPGSATAVPTWPPTMDVPRLDATIAAIARTLPTATLDVGRPLNKALVEQQDELYRRARATALANHTPVPVLAPIDTPVPPLTPWGGPPTQVAGAGIIIQTDYCGLYKLITTRNVWRETASNTTTMVCAGNTYISAQHAQLLVVLVNATTDIVLQDPALYDAPSQAESVEIIDAVGERLTLRADDGTLFYFDVPTRQWVNPTPAPSPVPSLPPTP